MTQLAKWDYRRKLCFDRTVQRSATCSPCERWLELRPRDRAYPWPLCSQETKAAVADARWVLVKIRILENSRSFLWNGWRSSGWHLFESGRVMRGSSSELLLEASCVQCQSDHHADQHTGTRHHQQHQVNEKHDFQEQELRRRKLLELGFGASRRRPPRRTCRQRFNFYATSALAFVATSGGAALLFLVPLYVDPAISTLAADFSPDPVICTTSRREELAGLFNCTWSSCREGCTSDVYRCTHIYVTYTPWSNASMKNDTGGRGNSTGIAHTSTTSGKKVFNLRRRPAYFFPVRTGIHPSRCLFHPLILRRW